jgi:hypothetical protein
MLRANLERVLGTRANWVTYVSVLVTCFLIGGLTFYAAIVVPAATSVWGASDQGFVTRLVAWRFNALATPAWCALLVLNGKNAGRWMRMLMVTMLLIQVGLWVSHYSLDSLLDVSQRAVTEESVFYVRHQVYLWLTTAQILVGWGLVWGFLKMISSHESSSQASAG